MTRKLRHLSNLKFEVTPSQYIFEHFYCKSWSVLSIFLVKLAWWWKNKTIVVGRLLWHHFVIVLWQAERRRRLGLPPEEPSAPKPSNVVEEKKVLACLQYNISVSHLMIKKCIENLKFLYSEFIACSARYKSRANEGVLALS